MQLQYCRPMRDISAGLMNRALRRQLLGLHRQTDTIFSALCNTSGATTAMSELWGSGYFDCGPQDYDAIVTHGLEALAFHWMHKPWCEQDAQAAPTSRCCD